MPVTATYGALLALLFVVLSFRVIFVRRGERISLGDGGNKLLMRRMRAHGNFAEYAPLALVLMGLAESLRTAPLILHAIGVLLCVGRLAHAVGLSKEPQIMQLRAGGMVATLTAILIAALACLWTARGIWM